MKSAAVTESRGEDLVESNKPLVLLIDNDLFLSVRIDSTLRKLGCDVVVVNSSEKAFTTAQTRHPSLVIINYAKANLSPLEITRRLKSLPNPAPILGYISHGLIPEFRPESKAAGCDLLVANSVITGHLDRLIARLLSKENSPELAAETERLADELD